jgi:hypothetical protein
MNCRHRLIRALFEVGVCALVLSPGNGCKGADLDLTLHLALLMDPTWRVGRRNL